MSISKCPKCDHWLNYDYRIKEYYCSNDDCDYTEQDAWEFKVKFRKELD